MKMKRTSLCFIQMKKSVNKRRHRIEYPTRCIWCLYARIIRNADSEKDSYEFAWWRTLSCKSAGLCEGAAHVWDEERRMQDQRGGLNGLIKRRINKVDKTTIGWSAKGAGRCGVGPFQHRLNRKSIRCCLVGGIDIPLEHWNTMGLHQKETFSCWDGS